VRSRGLFFWGVLAVLPFVADAGPSYVEAGKLPVPSASDRLEVFDPGTGILLSSPTYNGDHLSVACACSMETGLPVCDRIPGLGGPNWGRFTSDGSHIYTSGGYGSSAVSYADLRQLTAGSVWTPTTAIPGAVDTLGRSLHQAFVFDGYMFVLGGWHGDKSEGFDDALAAPIQSDGSLGAFSATSPLPMGMFAHSVAVSDTGAIYLVHDDTICRGQVLPGGKLAPFDAGQVYSAMFHRNCGNCGAVLLGRRLIVVDLSMTYVFALDSSGTLLSNVIQISNPGAFGQRYAFAFGGDVYVATDAGVLYRIADIEPHRSAAATAVVSNGSLAEVTVTDSGIGYTNTPAARIADATGTGAQVAVTVAEGKVSAINVIARGSGYSTNARVVVAPPVVLTPRLVTAPSTRLYFGNLTVGEAYQPQYLSGNRWSNAAPSFVATSSSYSFSVPNSAAAGGYRLAGTTAGSIAAAAFPAISLSIGALIPDFSYQVCSSESSDGPWRPFGQPFVAASTHVNLSFDAPGASLFYRLESAR
jgi:hypothetical protein